jgi:hypothetical protein
LWFALRGKTDRDRFDRWTGLRYLPGGSLIRAAQRVGRAFQFSTTTIFLEFQNRGAERIGDTRMLDLGVTKSFTLGDRVRLKLMMDLFNVFNTSNILTYASGNVSQANSTAPASIIPPRVLRFGLRASI